MGPKPKPKPGGGKPGGAKPGKPGGILLGNGGNSYDFLG